MEMLTGTIGLVVASQLIILGFLGVLILIFVYRMNENTKTILGEIFKLNVKIGEQITRKMQASKASEAELFTAHCTQPKCQAEMTYTESQCGKSVLCPKCHKPIKLPPKHTDKTATQIQSTVIVPEPKKQKARPAIIPLGADPKLPDALRAQCGSCGKGLRYPVRMSSKRVSCPDCHASFILPFKEDSVH